MAIFSRLISPPRFGQSLTSASFVAKRVTFLAKPPIASPEQRSAADIDQRPICSARFQTKRQNATKRQDFDGE